MIIATPMQIEEEEAEEFEKEMEERRAERAANMPGTDLNNPSAWIESMGGMEALQQPGPGGSIDLGGGMGGGQAAMAFIKIKPGYSRQQVEEYIQRWRDLLLTNGFDLNPYLVEDDLIVMHTEANHRIGELKAFVLNLEFSDGIVDYFEINQAKTYPDGHPEKVLQEKRARLGLGELLNFTEAAQRLANGEAGTAAVVAAIQALRDQINRTFEKYTAEPRPRGQFMDKKEDYASAEYYLKVAKILADDEANATKVVAGEEAAADGAAAAEEEAGGGGKYTGYVARVKAEKERHTKIYKNLQNPHEVKKTSEMKANILGAFLYREPPMTPAVKKKKEDRKKTKEDRKKQKQRLKGE
eukprot:SAG22_NODE_535_length_9385_cov_6.941202_1_plen_355_part_00